MLSTFGGGSARGFGGPGIGGGLSQFTFSLINNNGTHQREGDSSSTVSSFFTSALASDPGYINNSGTSSGRTGHYTFTTAVDCVMSVNAFGASGGLCASAGVNVDRIRGYGRDIDAEFNISAGTAVVFFAGYIGSNSNSNGASTGGTGGGATVLYTRETNTSTPLLIAAGGSGASGYDSMQSDSRTRGDRTATSAVPINAKGTGNHSGIRTLRDGRTSFSYGNTQYGGVGRSGAGGGGAGWDSSGYDASGTHYQNMGDRIRNLGVGGTGNAGSGGFGGGGGADIGNGYAGAGGGYFGGCEVGLPGGLSTSNQYAFYTTVGGGDAFDDKAGPVSFVANNANNFTDNGIKGSPNNSNNAGNDVSQGGGITFTFNPQ